MEKRKAERKKRDKRQLHTFITLKETAEVRSANVKDQPNPLACSLAKRKGTKASGTSAQKSDGPRARKNKKATKAYRPSILGRFTSKAPIKLHIQVESGKGNSVLVTCASMILPT